MNERNFSSIGKRSRARDMAEYLLVLGGSLIGWTIVSAADAWKDAGTVTLRSIGGSKANILLALAIGIPVGSLAGLIFARRVLARDEGVSATGIVVAATATIGSLVVGVAALDLVSSHILWLLPAVASAACEFGYRGVLLRRHAHRAP